MKGPSVTRCQKTARSWVPHWYADRNRALQPEVNCKPGPKSALYLLMWFAYHRLVPWGVVLAMGGDTNFILCGTKPVKDLNWGRVKQGESSSRGKGRGCCISTHTCYLLVWFKYWCCSILTLFCRLHGRKKTFIKFLLLLYSSLPPSLPCCKKITKITRNYTLEAYLLCCLFC